jgi:predicted P-loop ATPase/GTPase
MNFSFSSIDFLKSLSHRVSDTFLSFLNQFSVIILSQYEKKIQIYYNDQTRKAKIPDEEKGCNVFILFILFLSSFVSKYDGYKNPK